MRVLFFGTPDFATPPLRALVGEGHDVVGVVTQPDRARGRSRSQLDPSPVKVVALEEAIPVLQPDRPRGEEFLAQVRALEPDISVVVAYGHILPQALIELPPMGTLNIHASLLPQYRGAAPIQAAVRDGRAESGVTIMRMVRALDAGPVILALTTPIAADETAGELQLRLAELGAEGLIEALVLLGEGQATGDVLGEGGFHAVVIILEFGALACVFGCAVGVALHHGDSLVPIVNVLQLLTLGFGFVVERAVGVVVVRGCAVFRVGHLEQALV